MATYLVNHNHGCGCEEIEAESAEQAIDIRRSQLTEREADYEMTATLADFEITEVRSGSVLAKACKTDPVFQKFSVRQLSDGSVQYYHKQNSDWYTIPSEWLAEIVWS